MKKTISTLTLVCLLSVHPMMAQEAANVAGKWQMTNETPRGTMTSSFAFEQDGNVLTGTVETRGTSTPISTGTVDGNVITFSVVRAMGNRTRELTYTGTVEGDTITGQMTTPRGERAFTMTRVQG
jgi:hypothetical protein